MIIELIARNAGDAQEHFAYKPSPSKVGHCIRAMTYDALGVPPDPYPDRTLLVFEDGNWAEEIIKDHIRKTVFSLTEWKGKKQRIEIAEIDGQMMSGEIDGLLEDPLGQIYLLEIKSINHFGFERLKDKPQENHQGQANLYLHGLARAGFKIEKAIILYKNKNTSAMKEFVIDYDLKLAESDIEIFRQIAQWVKEKKVPKRPYELGDWQCQYCRWNRECYKNYDAEFAALSTDAALSEEIATAARYYKELGAQESEIKTQRNQVKETIKAALRAIDSKGGKAGEYLIELKRFFKNEFTVAGMWQEKLNVVKMKEGNNVHANKK